MEHLVLRRTILCFANIVDRNLSIIKVLRRWINNAGAHEAGTMRAKKYLGSSATRVPCESLFSMSGHIINKKRASLVAHKANELVCLNNWLKSVS